VVIFWLVEIENVVGVDVGVGVGGVVEIEHDVDGGVDGLVEIKHVAFIILGCQQVEIETRNIIRHL
jgi:hypothetical protein